MSAKLYRLTDEQAKAALAAIAAMMAGYDPAGDAMGTRYHMLERAEKALMNPVKHNETKHSRARNGAEK